MVKKTSNTNKRTRPKIRQATVDFIKNAIEAYCSQNKVRIFTSSGNGFRDYKDPTRQIHLVRLGIEYCHSQYPILKETSHFYSGVMLVVEEWSDDQLRTINCEVQFIPNHQSNSQKRGFSLQQLQEEIEQDRPVLFQRKQRWFLKEKWQDVIAYQLHQAMTEDKNNLKRFR